MGKKSEALKKFLITPLLFRFVDVLSRPPKWMFLNFTNIPIGSVIRAVNWVFFYFLACGWEPSSNKASFPSHQNPKTFQISNNRRSPND